MQIKDLDKLEMLLNQININLSQVKSLSKILLDCLCSEGDSSSHDIENLSSVLNDKLADLKEKFSSIEKDLYI